MTVITIVGLIGVGLYAAGLIALTVMIARTPPVSRPLKTTPITLPLAELSPEDEQLVAEAAARMKAYGNAVADRYDTEGNQ